jgi:hypothetical protein
MDVISRPGNLPAFLRALGATIADTAVDLGSDGTNARVNIPSGTWFLQAGDEFTVTRPDGQSATEGTIASAVAAAKVLP